MAERLGETERSHKLTAMAASGREILESRLWNGEWYIQEVDLEKHAEQNWATGLHSDHLLGEWWAQSLQLPSTLDPEHIRTAVESIFKYNFRENLEGIPEPERWFGTPKDAGLINCTWPRDGRPEVPTRYSDEVWTGIEYEVAGLLISTGQIDSALELLTAVRKRYNGERMNPWNDIECGDHYVRAMSSWSILLAATDFGWDAHLGELRLGNKTGQKHLVAPYFAAPAWGQYEIDETGPSTRILVKPSEGSMAIRSIVLPSIASAVSATTQLEGRNCDCQIESVGSGIRITFGSNISLAAAKQLSIQIT